MNHQVARRVCRIQHDSTNPGAGRACVGAAEPVVLGQQHWTLPPWRGDGSLAVVVWPHAGRQLGVCLRLALSCLETAGQFEKTAFGGLEAKCLFLCLEMTC